MTDHETDHEALDRFYDTPHHSRPWLVWSALLFCAACWWGIVRLWPW